MKVVVPQPAREDEVLAYPDAKNHLYISLVKSAIRIAAGFAFCIGPIWAGGLLIVVAEILGIFEELV